MSALVVSIVSLSCSTPAIGKAQGERRNSAVGRSAGSTKANLRVWGCARP